MISRIIHDCTSFIQSVIWRLSRVQPMDRQTDFFPFTIRPPGCGLNASLTILQHHPQQFCNTIVLVNDSAVRSSVQQQADNLRVAAAGGVVQCCRVESVIKCYLKNVLGEPIKNLPSAKSCFLSPGVFKIWLINGSEIS